MTKAITIAVALLTALAVPTALGDERVPADQRSLTVLFTGGAEDNEIVVRLSEDGRSYVVDSVAVLEVGGEVCVHPDRNPFRLICEAKPISGFEVNAGRGDDRVVIGRDVPVPVTLRGGPGDDRLLGGSESDKLVGGAGADLLVGRGGDDRLYGGPGDDKLVGASGDDLLRGGPGRDRYFPGGGEDRIVREPPKR